MKYLGPIVLLLLVSTVAGAEPAAPTVPYDLQEIYRLSVETSERLQRSVQDIKIAEAQYRQVLAAVYPQLNVGLEQRIRDDSEFGRVARNGVSAEDGATPTAGTSGTIGRSQLEGTLSVSQEIFNGFREFLLADALEYETQALRLDLQRNRELLFLDVAALFYQALQTEAELAVLDRSEDTLKDRVRELENFRSLGKSRDSEVLAARADRQTLLAEKARTLGVRRATLELLAFLSGVPASDLVLDSTFPLPLVDSLDSYLDKVHEHAELRAAALRVDAQRERVRAAERAYWPRLSLVGTTYPYEDPNRTRDWEVALRLSMPLFDGGRIDAQTDEAEAQLRSADLLAQEIRRLIHRDIRTAFERTQAAQQELIRLQDLVQTLRKSYQSQRRDYDLGVVSNLEVLQAIRQLNEAQRQLVVVRHSVARNLVDLRVAAGGIDP